MARARKLYALTDAFKALRNGYAVKVIDLDTLNVIDMGEMNIRDLSEICTENLYELIDLDKYDIYTNMPDDFIEHKLGKTQSEIISDVSAFLHSLEV